MPATILRTRNGRLDAPDKPKFDSFANRLIDGDAPLMFYVHGGLVNEAAGVATAQRLSGPSPDGYETPSTTEQLFVVWRTGLLETIGTNWRDLHAHDRLYRALLGKLLEFFARRVLGDTSGRGAGLDIDREEVERRLSTEGDAPFADLDTLADVAATRGDGAAAMTDADFEAQLGRELTRNSQVIAASQDIEATSAPNGGRTAISGDPVVGEAMLRRMDNGPETEMRTVVVGGTAAGERGLTATVLRHVVLHGVAIGSRVLHRMREGRDHGIHATIVEELVRELYGNYIGAAVWDMMRQDAAEHFVEGAMGSALLDVIASGPRRRVTLIGHSAGSIMISRMLLEMTKRRLDRQVEIILLAPAVRGKLFAEALGRSRDRITRFRMFALSDERERRDALLGPKTGYLYPSSLLYLVSGLFEDENSKPFVDAPILGMQRFRRWAGASLGEGEDGYAKSIAAFFNDHPDSEVYAPAAAEPGLSSDATTHGGMDDDHETLASVGIMLR